MQLVRSGYSWSGHERNCVFLNCTPTQGREGTEGADGSAARFADASAISGLDFPDDGRSVAVVDWDHDGDLDLWLRNRTAPRLRFMRNLTNEIAPDDQHISLHLIGTTCNRDALGARAELVLKTTGPGGPRLVRSVRAGDAFLSQSSKRLHFGIKKDASVEHVIVTWPGGEQERFTGVSAGASYEIKQGAGQAVRLPQRKPVSLVAKAYGPLPPTAAARVVLPGKVALPPLALRFDDPSGSLRYASYQAPTLVTFWTSSCPNCRQELADIAEHRAEFESANLSVMAVCLDGLDKPNNVTIEANDANDAKDAKKFLQEIEFPFPRAWATRETIERIRHFQNALFSTYPSFVVPLSFIVDSEGQVVSIYRGSFSHETYVQDRALVDLDDVTLRTLATPLVGTWITEPATRSQFAEFVGARLLADEPNAALRYYEAATKTEKDANRQRGLQEQTEQLRRFLQRKETE